MSGWRERIVGAALLGAAGLLDGCVSKRAVAVDGQGACSGADCGASGAFGAGGGGAADASTGSAGGAPGADGSAGASGGGSTASGGAGTDAGPPIPEFTLVVDEPVEGATVSGVVTVRGRGPGFLNVEVWDATHKNPALAQVTPGNDGAFTTTVNVTQLAPGPTTWTISGWDSAPGTAFTHTAGIARHLVIESTTPDAGPPSCAVRAGAPGHVAPTCVRNALFGGAYVKLDAWAAKLGRVSLDLQSQWDDVNVAPKTNDAAADWGWIAGHFSTDTYVVQTNWPGALSIGMPMWVRGQSATTCASGASDADMRRAITTLKSLVGSREVYVRLGWEFNGDTYPTQSSAGDTAYEEAWKDCWIRWYDVIKSVSPKYMVVWNPRSANPSPCPSGVQNALDLWPGAEFVDAAGPDQYDALYCGQPVTYDQTDGGQPIGIGAWADWVIAQGVPFAVPEWGVDSGGSGAGDRAQFVRDMYAAFKKAYAAESGLAFQSYFDGGAAYGCRYSLLDDACALNPNASATYFDLFKVWPPR